MKHRPALYALIRLHGELQGWIKQHHVEAMRARTDMRHVEHVIKLLEPGFNIAGIAARRKYSVHPVFRRRKMIGAILSVLREAGRPLTAHEIASELKATHKLQMTRAQAHHFEGNITKNLRRHEPYVSGDGGRPQRWGLAKPTG
jgi:hypothetical protein